MDPLAWLGLKAPAENSLSRIQRAVREVLPDDEAVVIRYIVVVSVLLTRVAYSDGRFQRCERDHLRSLLQHVERLPPDGIESLCATLDEWVPQLTSEELSVCYRELKSLCDAKERRQVMRLLASLATVDGVVATAERAELEAIAAELSIPEGVTEELLGQALEGKGSVPPPPN